MYLPGSAVTVLKKLRTRTAFFEFVCSNPNTGERYTEKNMTDALKRACKACSIPYRSSHKMRKTYSSTLNIEGADGKFIQSQLGHASYVTTQAHYLYDMTDTKQKLSELDRVFGNGKKI